MNLTIEDIHAFQTDIFRWWKNHRRDLPWRNTSDPYQILVSEVMLQQTQVSRVLPKYVEFLISFPTILSLSSATPAQVLRVWRGMGYNRRAIYLQKLARIVVENHSGIIPDTQKELRMLPGLGIYTVRAILVFAFRHQTYLVDTNIRKIITHHFFDDKPQKETIIEDAALCLLPQGKSWEWHQALMDYGALELPKILPKRKRTTQPVKFHTTDRYFRGRIIDELRKRSYTYDIFIQLLIQKYSRNSSYYSRLLNTLLTEGLISIDQSRVSLPS